MEKTFVEEALKVIDVQLEKLENTIEIGDDLGMWRDRAIRMLSEFVVRDEIKLLNNIDGQTWAEDKRSFKKFLHELRRGIQDTPKYFLLKKQPLEELAKKKKAPASKSNRVFIVHGHDSLPKIDVARTLEKLGLEAIILHEQANEGKTIIEKFERDASQVNFAIVIFSPDDLGYPKNKPEEIKHRARQNVILELGYFSGILGRKNVCVLYNGEVEIPSDYLGVVYIEMNNTDSWKFELSKELKQAGLKVDLNKLI